MISEIFGLTAKLLSIFAVLVSRENILYILLVSRVFESAAGVIGNICRSPNIMHLTRKNNFADCKAKEGN